MSEELKTFLEKLSKQYSAIQQGQKDIFDKLDNLPKEAPKEEPHEHWSAKDILESDCPECKKEAEKIGKSYMKDFLKTRKDYDLVCTGCGTPVKETEEKCPTCGSEEARRR